MYSAGSDSINLLRALSEHDNYENKVYELRPMWTQMRTWQDCLQKITAFITVPIVDSNLVQFV